MKNLITKLTNKINDTYKIEPNLKAEELLRSEKKYRKRCKIAKYIHLSGSPLYLLVTLLTHSITPFNIVISILNIILNVGFFAQYHVKQKAIDIRISTIENIIESKKYDYLKAYIKTPSQKIVKTISKLNNEALFELDPEINTFIQNSITNNVFAATQDFAEIFTYLNNTNLNDEEILNIICHIYCKNYELFNGKLCDIFLEEKHFNPTKSKYFHLCEQVNLAKNIINNGIIIPNNIEYNEETKNILTLDGFLHIPESLLKMIINKSNSKYRKEIRKENKLRIKREKLNTLLEKANNSDYEITQQDISVLKELLRDLDYQTEEAQKIINSFIIKFQEAQKRKQNLRKENEDQITALKQEAYNTLSLLLKIKDSILEPYKFLSDNEIEKIKDALITLGYTEEKINLVINKINKFNKSVQNVAEQNRILTLKNHLFQRINEEESEVYSDNVENLYTAAINFINDSSIDITLKFYKDKLINLINYIDECILSLLNNEINDEDLDNLKLAFLEIDSCFIDIYNINPAIRTRLDKKN